MRWIKTALTDGWNNRKFLLIGWIGMTAVTGYLMLFQGRIIQTYWKTDACRMDFLLFLPVLSHYGLPFVLLAAGSYGRFCFQEHRILRFSSQRGWWLHSLISAVGGILVSALAAGICALLPVWITHDCTVNWGSQLNLMAFYTNSGKDVTGELAFIAASLIFGYCLGVCRMKPLAGFSFCSWQCLS